MGEEHIDTNAEFNEWCPDEFVQAPTGGLNASAWDMATYVRFYLNRGRCDDIQVLQSASIDRIETAATLPCTKLGRFGAYGVYNNVMPEGPFVFHGHNGAVPGGLSEMAYLPEEGCGCAVMINSGNGIALYQITKLMRHCLTNDLPRPGLPPVVPINPDLRGQYTGYYQCISPRDQWLYGFERMIHITRLTFDADGKTATT